MDGLENAHAALAAIGTLPDDEIDLAAAALQLARVDLPDEDWRAAERHLSDIARAAINAGKHLQPSELDAKAELLRNVLAGHFGYDGDRDTYDDWSNANLIRVVQRRRGLPVALGILWLHAAHAAGWDAAGLNLPGHFLIGLRAPRTEMLVLDPFGGGVAVDVGTLSPAAFPAMLRREILLRLQNNIRLRRIRAEDYGGAIACSQEMLTIAPDATSVWLETGLLFERVGEWESARRCYGKVTELAPTGEPAQRARAAMQQLRGRLH